MTGGRLVLAPTRSRHRSSWAGSSWPAWPSGPPLHLLLQLGLDGLLLGPLGLGLLLAGDLLEGVGPVLRKVDRDVLGLGQVLHQLLLLRRDLVGRRFGVGQVALARGSGELPGLGCKRLLLLLRLGRLARVDLRGGRCRLEALVGGPHGVAGALHDAVAVHQALGALVAHQRGGGVELGAVLVLSVTSCTMPARSLSTSVAALVEAVRAAGSPPWPGGAPSGRRCTSRRRSRRPGGGLHLRLRGDQLALDVRDALLLQRDGLLGPSTWSWLGRDGCRARVGRGVGGLTGSGGRGDGKPHGGCQGHGRQIARRRASRSTATPRSTRSSDISDVRRHESHAEHFSENYTCNLRVALTTVAEPSRRGPIGGGGAGGPGSPVGRAEGLRRLRPLDRHVLGGRRGVRMSPVGVELLVAGDAADVEGDEGDQGADDVVGDVVPAEVRRRDAVTPM